MDIKTDKPNNQAYHQTIKEISYARRYAVVVLLFLVNLLNYMDRFTIAGVLVDVQSHYGIGDGQAGLLQGIFVTGFMLASPMFGYCGDRYNRKWLLVAGIILWSLATLSGSFAPKHMFWLFVLLRGMVGVGEASYSTIAPTIISDMFVKSKRSRMLMVFFFAIPVGSGLGYIVGSYVAKAFGEWQWALRVTPPIGIILSILLAVITIDPPRGMAEDGVNQRSSSTVKEDFLSLKQNKTFVLMVAGSTCVTFITGAFALFAPKFLIGAYRVQGITEAQVPNEQISLYTGIVTTISGFSGVALGTELAKKVKQKHRNGDALVCAFGILAGVPFLYLVHIISEYNTTITWVLLFVGQTLVFFNWPLVVDMRMYTVPATRRSTAAAVHILISHLFGDAASPYLLGVVSDLIRGDETSTYQDFNALRTSLYITLFIEVLGGSCFLMASLFLVKDHMKADAETKGLPPPKFVNNARTDSHKLNQIDSAA